jgi:lipopolysaccharide export system protein LptA
MRSAASILSPLLALACAAAPAFAQEPADGRSFTFRCRQGEIDLRTNQRDCVGVLITDGTVTNDANGDAQVTGATVEIRAAQGVTTGDNQWQLVGELRIALDTTELLADSAVFAFEADEIVHGEITGTPIVITDLIEERGETVKGLAEGIAFDGPSRTLTMAGRATFTLGDDEYRGCELIYNLRDKTLKLGSTDPACDAQLLIGAPEREAPPTSEPATP